MINARILVRKGLKSDFDPTKMLPGEWAVSIDASTSNQIVWMCFAPGVCKRMGTYEDFQNMIYNATGEIIERYEDAFGSILEKVNTNAETVSANTDIVLVAKSDIINTYLPQIKSYVSNASASASEAKTYSENAKASASEADKSAEDAKKYSQNAFSTTPEGYEALVGDVDLLKNAIVQTTDRTLYGSKEGGIKLIGIGGASEQGENPSPDNPQEIESVGDLKNLLEVTAVSQEKNGLVFTVNEDKTITVIGTATEKIDYIVSTSIYDNPVGESMILSGCPSGGSNSTYKMQMWHLNNGGVAYDYGSGAEFTLTEEMVSDTYNIAISIQSGTVMNHTFYPMIRKASVSNAEYKPYGYSLGIKEKGKNLFDKNSVTSKYAKVEMNGDSIRLYTETEGTYRDSSFFYPKLKPNTKYTISYDVSVVSGSATIGWRIKDGTTYPTGLSGGTGWSTVNATKKATFTTSENADYQFVMYCTGSSSVIGDVTFTNIQIEEGDTATPYEPYRSKSITIPLNEPLREGDEIAVVDSVWGINRKMYRPSLADKTWRYYDNNTAFGAPLDKMANIQAQTGNAIANSLCTHATISSQGQAEINGNTNIYAMSIWGSDTFIYFNSGIASSVDEFVEWLTENGVEVIYEVATPTFEPFTDQTPFYGLESFDTVTYISTDSEVEPSIELKFGKTEVGALTLLNYNGWNLARLENEALKNAVLSLGGNV